MNKQQRTQIISYLLTASLLLSFWVCVEECQAEVENDFKASFSVSQTNSVENAGEDLCSAQIAPPAVFSNQELFALTNFVLLSQQFRKAVFQQMSAPVLSSQSGRTFTGLPLKFFHQLRI